MFSPTTTVLLLLMSSVVYFLCRLHTLRRFYKDLPKPPHSLLWGHLKVMGEISATFPPNVHPQLLYTAIARKYDLKGIWYLDLWPIAPSQVILTDPDLMDEINIRRSYPQHPVSADFLKSIIGDKVIAGVNGPTWKFLHNAMAPAFSWSHINSLTDMMVDHCQHFCNTLESYAKSGEAFSMEVISAKLIFDVVAQIVYSFSLNAQTKGSQTLDDLNETILLAEKSMNIAEQFNPWLRFKTFWRRRRLSSTLDSEVMYQIRNRLDLLLKDKIVPSRKNPTSVLDLMLRQRVQDEEGNIKHGRSTDFTAEETELLVNNIKGLLLGGHGTTTDTLCYIYMLLTNSPTTITALIEEHTRVLGPPSTTITTLVSNPALLQQLPMTSAVIKETLRLFPVGFGLRQSPSPNTTLTYNSQTYPIPSRLPIVTNVHDLHYNPVYFADAATFLPTRWLPDGSNEIPRSYFRTFGRGSRACLGQNLAANELKIILVLTVRRFDFEYVGAAGKGAEKPVDNDTAVGNMSPRQQWTGLDTVFGDAVFQELGLEAKPRGGVWMRVRRRTEDERGEE